MMTAKIDRGQHERNYRVAERRLWRAIGRVPTEQRLRLTDSAADVRANVSGHGPTVLFLHGRSSAGASWIPLVGQLRGLRCVLPDLPAPVLRSPLVDSAASWVVDLVDALEVDRVDVVALGTGALAAARASAGFPERIGRVIEVPSRSAALPSRSARGRQRDDYELWLVALGRFAGFDHRLVELPAIAGLREMAAHVHRRLERVVAVSGPVR
jgi:pimeloyl-ACP methyl ester carboxylesterase